MCTVRSIWPFDLWPYYYVWPWHLIYWLVHYSGQNLHHKCFIFSRQINLTFDFYIVGTFWLSTLILWPSPWHSSPGHWSATIHGSCFIFSRHINIIWDLCTDGSFESFNLWPWNYDLTAIVMLYCKQMGYFRYRKW